MFNIIAKLEATASKLEKEEIVREQACEENTVFFEGCRLAYDALVVFGVKQVPEKKEPSGEGLVWDDFMNLCKRLMTREVTGNAASEAILIAMAQSTQEQWNGWYRRILIKDMRAGFQVGTINRVVKRDFPAYTIPVFECQLAHDSAKHESKVSGKKMVEVKLDGVRVITILYPNGDCTQYSRNGKELVNFPHIKEQFTKSSVYDVPMVFDGEVMSANFQDLMQVIHKKNGAVAASDAVLHLFDALPLDDFNKGIYNCSQEDRTKELHRWFNEVDAPNIAILDHEIIDLDTAEGQVAYAKINAKAIEGGYEGIMIKDLDAPYECKRSASWLKLKPFIEVSLEVVDVEEGTGKNKGRMGALVCEGNDDGTDIAVNVGSGFSDTLRDTIWSSRNDTVGRIVEVRADAITQNKDGTYSLRFPRFKTFRGFEAGEKI
jgi:DNA ligase-1